jgi:glycosyltransferase involved in cell wall biosynthesis
MTKEISIIFCTLDTAGVNEYLTNQLFIESLAINTKHSFETIAIVRDKSKIPIYETICHKVIYVDNALGHGFSFNEGAKIAEGKYLAFCDNDIIVSHEWDKILIEELEKDLVVASPDSRMVQNYEKPWGDFTVFDSLIEKITPESQMGLEGPIRKEFMEIMNEFDKYIIKIPKGRRLGFGGDFLMTTKEFWEKVKYDETFLWGGSDWDYFLQIISQGYPPTRIICGAYVYHRPHLRKYSPKHNEIFIKKWSNIQLENLLPKSYSIPMINLNENIKQNKPKVFYAVGVYAGGLKIHTDYNIEILKENNMLAGLAYPEYDGGGDLFPPIKPEKIIKSDIYHGHLNKSLAGIKRAKELNSKVKIILQMDSSHPKYVKKILNEEYDLLKTNGMWRTHDISVMLKEIDLSDFILVSSNFVANKNKEYGVPSQKIKIIPHTIKLDLPYIPYKESEFCVYYPGGAEKIRKGHYYIKRAVEELNNCGYKIKLLESLGNDSYEEILKKRKKCAIAVLPSIEDGYAASIRECGLVGRPILVSTNNGVADLIEEGENGWVIPIRDINAIIEKIIYLYNNRNNIIRIGLNMRKTILGETVEKYQNALLNFYMEILN